MTKMKVPKSEPARVVTLSNSTEAVITKSVVIILRDVRHALRLSRREAENLCAAMRERSE